MPVAARFMGVVRRHPAQKIANHFISYASERIIYRIILHDFEKSVNYFLGKIKAAGIVNQNYFFSVSFHPPRQSLPPIQTVGQTHFLGRILQRIRGRRVKIGGSLFVEDGSITDPLKDNIFMLPSYQVMRSKQRFNCTTADKYPQSSQYWPRL